MRLRRLEEKYMKHYITAAEARFMTTQLDEWLDSVDYLILENINKGLCSATVDIRTDSKPGPMYYQNANFYTRHLKTRGFDIDWCQSYLTIKW